MIKRKLRKRDRDNPYVSKNIIRIDKLIYRLKGVDAQWSKSGHLVKYHPKGHASELRTHFPDWVFMWAAKIQNKYPITRLIFN